MNTSPISLTRIGVGSTSVSRHLPGLREKFLAPEADLALVRYDGMLGRRIVKDAMLLTRTGKCVAFELPDDARQEFRGLCEALLDSRFPEWSEAEGAEGRFLWDLASDTLTHDHSLRSFPQIDMTEGVAAVTGDFDPLPEDELPF